MGGLIIGIFWGTLVSVVMLVAVSLSNPLPPRGGGEISGSGPADVTAAGEADEATTPDAGPEATEGQPPEGSDVQAPDGTPDQGADTTVADDATTPTPAPTPTPTAEVEVGPAPAPAPAAEVEAEAGPTPAPAGAPEAGSEDTPAGASEPATDVPLPSGSEFNRPPPEPEAALPAPDAAPASRVPQVLSLAGNETAPTFDTAPAAQPLVVDAAPIQIAASSGETTAPAGLALAPAPVISGGPTTLTQPEASAAPRVRTTLLPQVAPDPDATGQDAVVADALEGVAVEETAVEEAAVEEAAVEEQAVEAVAAPEADGGADGVADAAPAPAPEATPLPTLVFPTVGEEAQTMEEVGTGAPELPADMPADLPADRAATPSLVVPTPEDTDAAAPAFSQASGLPQVAIPSEPEAEVAAPEEADPVDPGDLPAIQAYAAPFDGTEERPLMAVVLIDDPDSRIELSTLTRFTFPVAFAIDPLHPEAATRATAYRDAGFEVVILGSMVADGATAMDTEVALMAAVAEVPEAVAVIDTPEGRIQGDRPVLDAMVGALADSGHGLVAFPRGLNAAEQSASRAGVPGATVFRFLDGENERATVITRFLSRAAFAAAQEGTVIVVGRTRPDTVTALFSWALGGRSEAVALAPLSATLLRAASE